MFHIEDAGSIPRVFAFTYFAFPVEVPIRRRHGFCNIRVFSLQGIEDMLCRYDVRFSAFESIGYTKETYEVGTIGVKVLPCKVN